MKKTYLLPFWLKAAYTLFLGILIPVYWVSYGPSNFLWFSDVSLILTYLGVMFEYSLFVSMAAVGGLILESLWIVDFVLVLLFKVHWLGLADYMFDTSLPFGLRALSYFHLVLPPLYIFLVKRLGYDRRAWFYQSTLIWIILIATYLITDPYKNINWVFSFRNIQWLKESPGIYLVGYGLILMGIFAFTHYFLILLASKIKNRASDV